MRIILLLIVTALISCKSDSSDSTASASENLKTEATGNKSATKGKVETNFNKNGIPDACDLLTQETIAKYVGIPASSIMLADGSSSKNDLQRACFFKWDGSEIKNAGVMVQVQQNPVAGDVPDYLTYMVQGLKTEGENTMEGTNTKFKDWSGFGDDGAYSTEVGKYVWRVGNDWAFMIAFNTTMSARDQQKAANAFAKEVMKRMTF
jgi:hypothetical protein|tara:strand:+ start:807 stop:1424 length:618 start_codon:yes stop_codon:yes gene_type:complete